MMRFIEERAELALLVYFSQTSCSPDDVDFKRSLVWRRRTIKGLRCMHRHIKSKIYDQHKLII